MEKRVAILGAGYIADYHRAALRLTPQVELVAVCDLDRARAERFAASSNIAAHVDLAEMLSRHQLDCVHVLTPAPGHVGPARQILEARVDVFLEKPLAVASGECEELVELARSNGSRLGVSHNFLCARPYEALTADLSRQRLGSLDQVDIVWQKALPQVQLGPFGSWLLSDPRHVLFEVALHSFAHALHLVGEIEELDVDASDSVELPDGAIFYRRWEVRGRRGATRVRMLFSFIDAYTQHSVSIRGSHASAHVDFERGTYVLNEPRHEQMDLDRFLGSWVSASGVARQASRSLANVVLRKARGQAAGPFADSISRAVRAFYAASGSHVDPRLSGEMGTNAVRLAERVAAQVATPPTRHVDPRSASVPSVARRGEPTILVTGGTGFIGKALVARLCAGGHGVRVLARSPDSHRDFMDSVGAEIVAGDMLDAGSVEAALVGIETVYHLARGEGQSWLDYEKSDCEPTEQLARACLSRGILLIYTSSIVVHAPSNKGRAILDDTPPHPGRARSSLYARAKAESERTLSELHRLEGLRVVIVRPGIVIGRGCTPLHQGIGAFPYGMSLCSIAGTGDSPLPIVLLDDCVAAMAKVVEAQSATDLSGRAFNIVGEPCLTAHEYLDELERSLGVKIRRITTPAWRGWIRELAKSLVKWVSRSPDVRAPSYASVKGLAYLAPYDISGIKRELDWAPTADRAEVVRQGIHVPARQFFG